MLHWPAATVPVQLSTPSLTVTLPVGIPVPGALTAISVSLTLYNCSWEASEQATKEADVQVFQAL